MQLDDYAWTVEAVLKDNHQDPIAARISLDNSHSRCWVFSRGNSYVTICINDGQGMANHSLTIEIDCPILPLWVDGSTPLCLISLGKTNPVLSQYKICDQGFSITMNTEQINIDSTAPLEKINFDVISQVLGLVDTINLIGDHFYLETETVQSFV